MDDPTPTNKDIFKQLSARIIHEQWERFWKFFWKDEYSDEKGGRLGVLFGVLSCIYYLYATKLHLQRQAEILSERAFSDLIFERVMISLLFLMVVPGVGWLLGRGIAWCFAHLEKTWDSLQIKWKETKSKLSGDRNGKPY